MQTPFISLKILFVMFSISLSSCAMLQQAAFETDFQEQSNVGHRRNLESRACTTHNNLNEHNYLSSRQHFSFCTQCGRVTSYQGIGF